MDVDAEGELIERGSGELFKGEVIEGNSAVYVVFKTLVLLDLMLNTCWCCVEFVHFLGLFFFSDVANMWRSSGDIGSAWKRVLDNLGSLVGQGEKGGPGRWNDPGERRGGITQLQTRDQRCDPLSDLQQITNADDLTI